MARHRRTLDDWEDERKLSTGTQWLTPKEASAYCKLGVSTLAKRRMAGLPPVWHQPLPNSIRYSARDLDAFMQSTRVSPTR